MPELATFSSYRRTSLGKIAVPGDKSLSHRALIFSALAEGVSVISGILESEDIFSTVKCLESLGVAIRKNQDIYEVVGKGLKSLVPPMESLKCGNSGTTMRLLTGVLAGQDFESSLIGDSSLSRRPMLRVTQPLSKMGAQIELTSEQFAPVKISGRHLRGMEHTLAIPSAQVKGALLLAGLFADGQTGISGRIDSRDHTERLLSFFGVEVKRSDSRISVEGGSKLRAQNFRIPSDPSSAAFWAGAAALEGSEVVFEDLLLNPSRLGFFKVLKEMGVEIEMRVDAEIPEPRGTLKVRASRLNGIKITPDQVPTLIDELPLLAVLATQATGMTEVHGASELRVKESDRIESLALGLRSLGIVLETFPDGFKIEGPQKLKGSRVDSFGDHRIAMSFVVASLVAEDQIELINPDCIAVSYPGFLQQWRLIHGH